jgi:hypothetical protein
VIDFAGRIAMAFEMMFVRDFERTVGMSMAPLRLVDLNMMHYGTTKETLFAVQTGFVGQRRTGSSPATIL